MCRISFGSSKNNGAVNSELDVNELTKYIKSDVLISKHTQSKFLMAALYMETEVENYWSKATKFQICE